MQCVKMMRTMYSECKLVHADLSEYNILYFEKNLYFIDVSQSVRPQTVRRVNATCAQCAWGSLLHTHHIRWSTNTHMHTTSCARTARISQSSSLCMVGGSADIARMAILLVGNTAR